MSTAASASPRRYVRPGVYFGIVIVLGLMTGVAIQEALVFEKRYVERERDSIEKAVVQQAAQWERSVLQRLDEWFRRAAESNEPGLLEAELRQKPYVDALYLWDAGELVYPPPAVEEQLAELRATACLGRAGARSLPTEGVPVDAVALADEYGRCVVPGNLAAALLAASTAADLYLDAGEPQKAYDVVTHARAVSQLPASRSGRASVDAQRPLKLQAQWIRTLHALGRVELAVSHLDSFTEEWVTLDGPVLDRTLDLYEQIFSQEARLLGISPRGGESDEAFARARRRLAAWRQLRDVDLDPRGIPGLGETPRVYVDPYGDPPWIIVTSRLGFGELTGAIQLDQQELLRDFLEASRDPDARYLSIRDTTGNVLAGSSDTLAVGAPFPQVLTHLRVGITLSAESTHAETQRAFFARLLPFGLAIGVGLLALYALIRTDRQQELLLERQRDFVARVSHELKTPLAGIRVMAENIEIGAVRDDAQRTLFARRIVAEAEKLTDRVNEVIRAAMRPADDVPVPVDVDALYADLVAAWRPRFEAVGATLDAEAQSVGVVRGMPVLLRDALNNLLDNALKYRKHDRGGRVWLQVRGDRRWVVFEVSDDGLGVPVAHRKSIFDRFRRVEGPGRGKGGGHGLGLSFVAETAQLHGGKAECLDGVEGGARFVLRIRRKA